MKVLSFCPSSAVSSSLPGLIIFFITFHIHKLESGKHLKDSKEGVTEIDDFQRELDWRRNIVCPGLGSSAPPVQEVNVTLDPDTAHPNLILSEGRKSVRWEDTRQQLPNNPERFDTEISVLGCEGFTSGRHYWEVEVGGGGGWAVGVARESVRRKGEISRSPEGGIWAVECWGGQFRALTSPETPLPLSRAPSRIRIYLDCERGQVTFIDAGDEAPIFTFPPGSVRGGRIRPWLQVWDADTWLRLCL
ncbi:butyrophilin subfamily 1 member A1-like isoform X2 [Chrysemys picta bellii]|uniref:butyrophilin subfamily 1 member A1-like isoform X2 n=1 Tax=Chrysemys picta bellii TaxID=8478 RepID=UPI0032B2BE54